MTCRQDELCDQIYRRKVIFQEVVVCIVITVMRRYDCYNMEAWVANESKSPSLFMLEHCTEVVLDV